MDSLLDAVVPSGTTAPQRLHAAMRHALFAGGKRLRPALVRASNLACGGSDADGHPAMCAIELLHTYTLVHDDLPAMDDDHWRRGQPTVHVAYDEATAILAGDALQALAFGQASLISTEAVSCLAQAAGSLGVVGGQQDDLDAERGRISRDDATLRRIHSRKTAALLSAACELGALTAAASSSQRRALATFGHDIGLAFQLIDDWLDVTANADQLGKTPGKDAAAGKLTAISRHGLAATRQQARQLHERALAQLQDWPQAETLRLLADAMLARSH
ncbi:MAG: polyprenyl synthetase family protein [Planctomycetota bacterium]